MEKVALKYSDLKNARNRILYFTEKIVVTDGVDTRTSIADDLSLSDLDGYEYLDEFQRQFQLDLPQSVYDYVCDPVIRFNVFQKLLWGCVMMLSPLLLILHIMFPFKTKEETMQQKKKENKNRLTLGDLTVSVAAGRFLKRENIEIQLTY